MQDVQRAGISLTVNVHQKIVIIGDAALSDTDQEHGDQEPDRVSADQKHNETQSHGQLDQDKGNLDSEQKGKIACQQSCQHIAYRLDRQQRSADLIGKRVIRLHFRQDRSQHDQDQSQRHVSIEQIQYNTQFSFSERRKKAGFFHKLLPFSNLPSKIIRVSSHPIWEEMIEYCLK